MNKEEIDNILKYQEELEKEYDVHHFEMYFEDGGELDVVEYDKFLELQQENQQLKLENEKLSLIRNKALNWFACPDRNKLQNLLEILKGDSNE